MPKLQRQEAPKVSAKRKTNQLDHHQNLKNQLKKQVEVKARAAEAQVAERQGLPKFLRKIKKKK